MRLMLALAAACALALAIRVAVFSGHWGFLKEALGLRDPAQP